MGHGGGGEQTARCTRTYVYFSSCCQGVHVFRRLLLSRLSILLSWLVLITTPTKRAKADNDKKRRTKKINHQRKNTREMHSTCPQPRSFRYTTGTFSLGAARSNSKRVNGADNACAWCTVGTFKQRTLLFQPCLASKRLIPLYNVDIKRRQVRHGMTTKNVYTPVYAPSL